MITHYRVVDFYKNVTQMNRQNLMIEKMRNFRYYFLLGVVTTAIAVLLLLMFKPQ